MTILGIIITVAVIIFALWLVKTFLPQPWQTPILVIVVILALVWVLTLLFPALLTRSIR